MTNFYPEFRSLQKRPDEHVIYISGPIKGFDDGNKSAFRQAKNLLLSYGFQAINPHEVAPFTSNPMLPNTDPTYEDFMRADIRALVGARVTGFAYLPDWEQSRGVLAEMQVAQASGIQMHPLAWWLGEGRMWMLNNHVHEYDEGTTETQEEGDSISSRITVIGVRYECAICQFSTYNIDKPNDKVGNP